MIPKCPDEITLMRFVLDGHRAYDFPDIHPNRLHYLLRKWTDKEWWDYGVSLRTGWLTDKGTHEIQEYLALHSF